MSAPPYRLYVLDVSYFSGKLEAYFRWKEIPFERIEATWRQINTRLLPHTGIARVPLVQTPDGTWLQDTTPIIDWLEQRHPDPPSFRPIRCTATWRASSRTTPTNGCGARRCITAGATRATHSSWRGASSRNRCMTCRFRSRCSVCSFGGGSAAPT